ncbi:MAG TPA: FAD-dependent oxidoreductase [Xanthomonadaceae bacterium]|nr:FAD-dependent oxidoreductase [Xanthomonadaceae bacterium]
MDLKSGYPYWAIKNGLMHAFPRLQADQRCDVAIIGGGITAALIANEFSAHGHDVVVVEQRDIGWGSTAASTALLQYEIDTHMVDLAKQFGEADAALAYTSCARGVAMLGDLAREVRDVGFSRIDSLYYASKRGHADDLRDEYAMRRRHGLEVELLETEAVRERYGIDAPAAILSTQAAWIDPYRMTYRLLARLRKNGMRVFDRSAVDNIETSARGVTLRMADGPLVHARHVILAAGYATQQWLPKKMAKNRSSYACITDPLDEALLGPLRHTMLWESARPYLYMRTTSDHRLLVGGEDDAVDIAAKRDVRVPKKAKILLEKVGKLFPQLPLQPAFAWAGTFAETDDGLPFFGPHQQHGPRVHYAMAYGGNGITYSMLGSGLLRALIERRKHPLTALFSFKRLDRG